MSLSAIKKVVLLELEIIKRKKPQLDKIVEPITDRWFISWGEEDILYADIVHITTSPWTSMICSVDTNTPVMGLKRGWLSITL